MVVSNDFGLLPYVSLLPFPAHLSITRTQVASDDPQSDVYYFVNPYSGGLRY